MIGKDKHLHYSNQNLTEADLPRIWAEAQAQGTEFLDLSKNHFAQITFPSYALPKLKVLELSYNQVEVAEITVPAGIFDNLMYLYLYKSKLQKITFTAGLPLLNTLHLADNQLTAFEANIFDFPTLETLYLYNNPIENTAIRGFAEQELSYAAHNCLPFLREYQEMESRQHSSIDDECKVLLIGNGGVGKTCFVERLVHDRFVEEWNSTHAISIAQYPLSAKTYSYLLNLWDFGGQDIYHATHRLFMQSNAIYLLFWDWQTEYGGGHSKRVEAGAERSYLNRSLAYWLAYTQSQGEGSPALVVQTKKSKDGKKDPKEKNALQEKFGDILIDFESIDSKIADWGENGLEEVSLKIGKAIRKIKKGSTILNNFAALRQALRDKQKEGIKEISFQEYEVLAGDFQITNHGTTITPQSVLENWLVKTGVVFYRQGLFENKIILDQAWAIKAIYTLFDREDSYYYFLQNKKGQFSGADLHKVWGKDHQEAEQALFVSFMLSCELCFENTPKEKEGKHYYPSFSERTFIAPQLLPAEKEKSIEDFWEGRKSWYIKYTHDFLHYGIIQSFIVRTNYLAEVRNIWQKGIFLKEDNARALVETQEYEKEIKVRITENGKNLLDKIRNLLTDLQTDKVIESVSLNGEDYVLLENLKYHHPENKYIKAENGKDVLAKDLHFFLEINKQAIFETIETMNIMNPTIQKALRHLQNANYSGYFEEMDKVVPVNMQTPYQEHKGKFITGQAPWNFHQQLETFAREVDKALLEANAEKNEPQTGGKTNNPPPPDKIKILMLTANPADTTKMNLDKEHSRIAEKLQNKQDKFILTVKRAINRTELKEFTEEIAPNVLHFSGHGMQGTTDWTSGIVVQNEDKNGYDLISASKLDVLFKYFK
ncbi:MAG: hypothetical protein MUE81_07380, partial [Thermoflexibacter sp.]|nr:hypothetical protein [Thermoflexibacter sp.]